MHGKKLIFFFLSAFVAATLFLIYIQRNSAQNIDTLIKGNDQYANEYKVNFELKELERQVSKIQSNIRRRITAGEPNSLFNFDESYKAVNKQLAFLQTIADDSITVTQVDVLDKLVHDKLNLSIDVLHTLQSSGQKNAQKEIDNNLKIWLMDSMYLVTENIEKSRHVILTKLAQSNAESGQKALRFNSILICLVLACGAALFWYITNIILKQVSLINKLHISEKKVTDSALLKEKFMANMSHEIRTPMNAIVGFTALLQRKQLDDESREYVNTIQKSGEMLLSIINDILDLSKIEAGMMRIESAPFNMQALLHSIETMFASKVAEKKLGFSVEIEETIPDTLEGDPTRLTQILVNLIGNAIKFTNKGAVFITIENKGIQGNIITAGITVADTGIGVDGEHLAHIFDRFQQAEDTVTRKYGGTGLGLAIVSDLVKLQNGNIKAESELGKGTSFYVQIPYKISTSQVPEKPEGLAAVSNTWDNGEAKILVVEDNEVNQSLLKHLFKDWGLRYDVAVNGKEALHKLKEKTYDLILMDIQMPVMDGYTAAKEIRLDLRLRTPIIAMTAHALAGEREKCLAYGMDDYISKPLREDQLRELITRFTSATINVDPVPSGIFNNGKEIFDVIDLAYMKEISRGNKSYEKTVTSQFINAITKDLPAFEHAWVSGELATVHHLAHNMKTTVSIMGLEEKLDTYLDSLEAGMLTEKSFYQNYTPIKLICEKALTEAKEFYASF